MLSFFIPASHPYLFCSTISVGASLGVKQGFVLYCLFFCDDDSYRAQQGYKKKCNMNMFKQETPNCIIAISQILLEKGTLGRTGEPNSRYYAPKLPGVLGSSLGQRACSTCLLERDPVRGRRWLKSSAKGKKPKHVLPTSNTAYSNYAKLFNMKGFASNYQIWQKTQFLCQRLFQIRRRRSLIQSGRLLALMKGRDIWYVLGSGLKLGYQGAQQAYGAKRRLGCGAAQGPKKIEAPKQGPIKLQEPYHETNDHFNSRFEGGQANYAVHHCVIKPDSAKIFSTILGYVNRAQQGALQYPTIHSLEVVHFLLKIIFEPQFLSSNHSFRSGKSHHTCLREIQQQFQEISWFIVGDVSKSKGCLLTCSYRIMRNFIRSAAFLDFTQGACSHNSEKNQPRFLMDKSFLTSKQLLADLFYNISLNELDNFVARLKRILNSHKGPKVRSNHFSYCDLSHDYTKNYNKSKAIKWLLFKIRNQSSGGWTSRTSRWTDARKFGKATIWGTKIRRYAALGPLRARGAPHALRAFFEPNGLQMDVPNHPKPFIRYVRTSNYFLVGVSGPRQMACKISRLVTRFIEVRSKLQLNKEAIFLKSTKEKIPFLGYLIDFETKRNRGFGKAKELNDSSMRGFASMVANQSTKVRRFEKRFASCERRLVEVRRMLRTNQQRYCFTPWSPPDINKTLGERLPTDVSSLACAEARQVLKILAAIPSDLFEPSGRTSRRARASLSSSNKGTSASLLRASDQEQSYGPIFTSLRPTASSLFCNPIAFLRNLDIRDLHKKSLFFRHFKNTGLLRTHLTALLSYLGRFQARSGRAFLLRSFPLATNVCCASSSSVLRTFARKRRSVFQKKTFGRFFNGTNRLFERFGPYFSLSNGPAAGSLECELRSGQASALGGQQKRRSMKCFARKKQSFSNNAPSFKRTSLFFPNNPTTKTGKIRLLVNMDKVIESLADKGFCDLSGNPKPNFQYFQDSQKKTVARVGSLLRGLTNYYQLAESKRRSISRLSYILTNSVAMMFAAKFKLRTRAKVFGLAGRNLMKPLLSKKRKSCEHTKRSATY
jgi:Type II intron maturase